jgi:hypothetical protein
LGEQRELPLIIGRLLCGGRRGLWFGASRQEHSAGRRAGEQRRQRDAGDPSNCVFARLPLSCHNVFLIRSPPRLPLAKNGSIITQTDRPGTTGGYT